MLEIDQNEELAIDMLLQPTFNLNKLSHEDEHQQVLRILSDIIENPKTPMTRKFWNSIHKFKYLCYKLKRDFKKKLI